MPSDRLITLAIHTFERAKEVKATLEQEGIHAEIHNVNLTSPEVAPGVRVRIHEADLPKALLIVENYDIFRNPQAEKSGDPIILVPTDFTPRTKVAVRVAMEIARKTKASLHFLNAYAPSAPRDAIQLAEVYNYETSDSDSGSRRKNEAENNMNIFAEAVRTAIKNGELPPVKFSTEVAEGIPEEVILDRTRQTSCSLLVMATRQAQKKEEDLIGSVTAEVLDGCKIPAITIPETFRFNLFDNINHVVFINTLDQEDLLAIDSLFRVWPEEHLDITLLSVPPRRLRATPPKDSGEQLLKYCKAHYPGHFFTVDTVSTHAVADYLNQKLAEHPFRLICIPNKYKNMVSRLFNPSIAHKLLFCSDIPMLVLPV